MDGSTLELLHPELQAEIMSYFPTLDSLNCLIRASPRLLQVFVSRKQQILSNMAMRRFHPAVLSDALATVKASQLGDSPSRDSVLEFIGSLPIQHVHHTAPILPLTTAVALCLLHEDIQHFVADFSKRSLPILADFSNASNPREHSPIQGSHRDFQSDLSTLEAARLQRAFCRFETYCYLFSKSDTAHTNVPVKEQSQLFLQLYSKWEIEEIACVRDHLIHRLCEVFDSMEEDFVQREFAGNTPVREESCLDRWEAEDQWYSSMAKMDQLENMEHLLSLGLSFLRQAFQAAGEERNKLIISNNRYQRRSFLSESLRQPKLDTETNDQDRTAYQQGLAVAFEEDAIDKCNEGWIWGHEYRPALVWASGSRKGLRSLGYVFWDHKRLESSGILSIKPQDIPDNDLDETSRFDQASAEERVEGGPAE